MRVALALLAACTHIAVFAQPSDLERHATELRDTGHTRVEVEQGGTVPVGADDPIVVTYPGDEHSYLWGLATTGKPDQTETITIRNFVAGCGTGGECLADRARGAIHVGTRHQMSLRNLGIFLFGAVAMAVSTTCLIVCHNTSGWTYVGTGVAAVTMIAPLTTVW
jgi:hypothetical protein